MIVLLGLFCIWNMVAVLIVASRIRKLNKHHHGGFTRGSQVYLGE